MQLQVLFLCQRPPGVMSVLDDICFQMHGQSEGADVKLLEVWYFNIIVESVDFVSRYDLDAHNNYYGALQKWKYLANSTLS